MITSRVSVGDAQLRVQDEIKSLVPPPILGRFAGAVDAESGSGAEARRQGAESRPGRSRVTTPTGSGLQLVAVRKLQSASAGSEVPQFVEMTRTLNDLARELRRGHLSDAALEARLAKLPIPPDSEYAALWTKECTRERRALEAAIDALAELRPNAVLYRGDPVAEQTLRESSLYAHVSETYYFGEDREALRRSAKAFLDAFPDSPRAAWVRTLIGEA